MYINNLTLEEITLSKLKQNNPKISYPIEGTEIIDSVWYYIHIDTKPESDIYTEDILKDIVELRDGKYYQTWVVTSLSQAEIDTNLELAQSKKEEECDRYGEQLISSAYSNPQIGITKSSAGYKKRCSSRRINNADKLASDITITQTEKDLAKIDQKLSEYETKIYADSDKAIINMLKLNTAIEIYNFNVSLESWTAWSPPV